MSGFFGRKDSKKTTSHKDSLMPLLLPSILGVLLCTFGLCGSTWAWFTASVSNEVAPIQAATYDFSVNVEEADGGAVVPANPDGSYALSSNKEYKITLTAEGTATTGYGKFKTQGGPLYTAPIAHGKSLSFTYVPESDGPVSFIAQWGTYSGEEPDITAKAKVGELSVQAVPEKAAPEDAAADLPADAQEDAPVESE